MKINFTKSAKRDIVFWKYADRKTHAKILALLQEILASPYSGRGKPEQLVGNLSGCWSRRINNKDRIVYRVDEQADCIFIYELRKHYND